MAELAFFLILMTIASIPVVIASVIAVSLYTLGEYLWKKRR